MSDDAPVDEPLAILITALGGEGGGVATEWLVEAATRAGHAVQATSIPGVAQRTGATTYYVEMARRPGVSPSPAFSLVPVPGEVDLIVATELLEAARVAAQGFVDAERTLLISSDARALTTPEKMAMADGRLDTDRLIATATRFSAAFAHFDMAEAARNSGTVVSAVLFGAIAASGRLPFATRHCEDAIKASGKGVAASLAGFAAGLEATRTALAAAIGEPPLQAALTGTPAPTAPATPAAGDTAPDALADLLPAAARTILEAAEPRLAEYQDRAYARTYRARLARLAEKTRAAPGEDTAREALLVAAARFLAVWMMFDDVIRVADLKTRRERYARVRREARAKPGDVLRIVDYFKPRAEELFGILPRPLEGWVRRIVGARGRAGFALTLRTDTLFGTALLRGMAALRVVRRHGTRFAIEQERIERWLTAIEAASQHDVAVGLEVALCGRLVKGYGETNRRAHENLERILATLGQTHGQMRFDTHAAWADALRQAREAALADPEGRTLDAEMGRHGVAARPLRAQPIVIRRRLKPRAQAI